MSPPAPVPPPPPTSPRVSEVPERRGPPGTLAPRAAQPFALSPQPRTSMGTGRHLRTAATMLLLSILVMGIGYPLLSAGLGTLLHAPAYPAAPSPAPTSNNSTANATLAVAAVEGGPISEPVLGPTTANMLAAAPPPGPARGGP